MGYIEDYQAENMRQYHKWTEEVREIEEKISIAKSEGRDWKSIYEYSLDTAKYQAQLNYELATDRGF
jgi:hypothetical protein